jgi:hypothetical protein
MKQWKGLKDFALSVAGRVWAKIQAEPVLVRTVLALLVSGGVLELTDSQLDRIDALVVAFVLVASAASARGAVTPLPPEERKRLLRRNRRKDSDDGEAS